MISKRIRCISLAVAAASLCSVQGCSPYGKYNGPQRSGVWGLVPMDVVLSRKEQHQLTLETPYWPFMQVRAEKDLFAVKFSWMRPDQQTNPQWTGGWLEFLAPEGGSLAEEPEAVYAQVESVRGKIPVQVVRLPVEGGRYFLSHIPTDLNHQLKLLITAEFVKRKDTVVVDFGSESNE